MRLIINGKEQVIDSGNMTIQEILKICDVKSPDLVSVQLNRKFIKREDYTTTVAGENDEIDFLYFMGGGGLIE